jgi:BirA family biotin operon repressor/biotin-[acetyl-CoA-carboxylase] ligase
LHHLNTLFVGKVLLQFHELDSTNSFAQELLAKSKPVEGTIVWTLAQPQGRGQHGSKWESEPGKNLTLSLILYPIFLPAWRNFALNKAVALAVRDFVSAYLPEKNVSIKWPNDIYVGDRKIGGILIQNTLQQSTIASTIIGIGLNINQVSFSSQIPNPTSLQLESAQSFELTALLPVLAQHLEQKYLQLRANNWEQLDAVYLQRLYRLGVQSVFQRIDGTVIRGVITGISDSGRLQISHDDFVETFDLKEVSFII